MSEHTPEKDRQIIVTKSPFRQGQPGLDPRGTGGSMVPFLPRFHTGFRVVGDWLGLGFVSLFCFLLVLACLLPVCWFKWWELQWPQSLSPILQYN